MNKICLKCKNELSYDNYNFDKNGKINAFVNLVKMKITKIGTRIIKIK